MTLGLGVLSAVPAGSPDRAGNGREFVLVGGSAEVGTALAELLCAAGARVTVVDREQPADLSRVTWLPCDLWAGEFELPPGLVVLLLGGEPPRWPWRAALDIAVPTARLLPRLAGRDVVLPLWPAGSAAQTAEADPIFPDWLDRLEALASRPCDPPAVAPLCRELVELSPTGDEGPQQQSRRALNRAVAAQRALLSSPRSGLGTLTLVEAPVESGGGPEADPPARVWARRLAEMLLPGEDRALDVPDVPGESSVLFHPPLPVVIPPRPAWPDVVASRQQQALWSGRLKAGNAWSTRCVHELREHLQLGPEYELLLTTSGTTALELAIVAAAGRAEPGAMALVPSFTFRATIDVLLRLGYEIGYVDVNPFSWTLDAAALATALDSDRVRLVVAVDTFGNPCAYEVLGPLCAARGIPLVADSAASLGSRYRGRPVGQQAQAHAFSMSFAKVLTAAGAGGAVTFRRDAVRVDLSTWTGSQLMSELHAIAALDQLPVLERLVQIRNEVASAYAEALQGVSGVTTQHVAGGDVHSYVHWVVRVPNRVALAERLTALGVLTKPYFPAQHRHHPVAVAPDRLPVTEQLDAQALALPTSSELSEGQIRRLQQALRIAFADLAAADGPPDETAKDA